MQQYADFREQLTYISESKDSWTYIRFTSSLKEVKYQDEQNSK